MDSLGVVGSRTVGIKGSMKWWGLRGRGSRVGRGQGVVV